MLLCTYFYLLLDELLDDEPKDDLELDLELEPHELDDFRLDDELEPHELDDFGLDDELELDDFGLEDVLDDEPNEPLELVLTGLVVATGRVLVLLNPAVFGLELVVALNDL